MWYPVVLASFGECRGCSGYTYLIDCYVSGVLESPIPRFLLIRRFRAPPKLSGSTSVEAPILLHKACSLGDFMRDAYKLQKLLRNEDEAVEELMRLTSNSSRNRAGTTFFRHGFTARAYVTGVRLLGEVLKVLCLNVGKPPTSWIPTHVLLGIDFKHEYAYFVTGSKEKRMKTLEEFLFTSEVLNSMRREVPCLGR
ncbi:MAG: hypothetical protein J7L55_05010 [Desulfurococcales archaeon]|nr:hypothetical protein [Desulfurococcales archaeon]